MQKPKKKVNRKVRRQNQQHTRQQQYDQYEQLPILQTPVKRKQVQPLEAKTEMQGQLIATILSKTISFATGPAGTGKTYIEASLAAEALESGEIDKLILTRPMAGCDEDMGFLPGEEEDKYAPWVQPIMDVLEERLGTGHVKYLVKSKVIECRPLMFMRGSSFKNTWMILDEAQNTTPGQMKMFLTRVGEGSKIMINGDVNQSDLKDGRGIQQENGLADALFRLKGVKSIGAVEFTRADVVRHGIIKDILERYEG